MNANSNGNSLLLLSGGMDSIALAWWLRPAYTLTIDYGQLSADGEIAAAAQVTKQLDLIHEVLRLDLRSTGSGDMHGSEPARVAPVPEWWPFRNQLLVTVAAARAVGLGASRVVIGSVVSDGVHADGSLEFYRRLNDIVRMQEGAVAVDTPAIGMTTTELIQRSQIPASVLGWSHSCHRASLACGACRGCNKQIATGESLDAAGYYLLQGR